MTANVGGQKTDIWSDGSPGIAAYQENSTGVPVFLETSSSAWYVPTSYYEEIVRNFPYVDNSTNYCPCSYADNDDSITLTFEGQVKIIVPAKEFIVPLYDLTTTEAMTYNDGSQTCAFMILPSDATSDGFWNLGDAVLRSMYVVYDLDNGQISIAQANVNSTSGPDIREVQAGPGGVANAVDNIPPTATQNYTIASPASVTAFYSVSTAESTVGITTVTATGTSGGSSKGQGGSSSHTNDPEPLSSGAKAGIGVGVSVAGLTIVALLVWFCLGRRKRRRNNLNATPYEISTAEPEPYGNRLIVEKDGNSVAREADRREIPSQLGVGGNQRYELEGNGR